MKEIINFPYSNSQITTLVLSNGRFDLLTDTIASYQYCLKYESTNYFLFDDSADKYQQDSIKNFYGRRSNFNLYLNDEQWGQARATDFIVSKVLENCSSEFIFWLEDDWLFSDDREWINQCKEILRTDPKVVLIGMSLEPRMKPYFPSYIGIAGVPIRYHNPWRIDENHGYWNGWLGSPHLMRYEDVEALPKLTDFIAEEVLDQQYWKKQYEAGKRSIWLNRQICSHIGGGRSGFPTGDMLPPTVRTWLKPHDKQSLSGPILPKYFGVSGPDEVTNGD